MKWNYYAYDESAINIFNIIYCSIVYSKIIAIIEFYAHYNESSLVTTS